MARIGWSKCGCCGNPEASVSKTDKGTLSITCHRCEFSAFAKLGTKAHRMTSAALVLDDDAPDPAPAPAPVPKPAKAAATRPAAPPPADPPRVNSIFSLGDLS